MVVKATYSSKRSKLIRFALLSCVGISLIASARLQTNSLVQDLSALTPAVDGAKAEMISTLRSRIKHHLELLQSPAFSKLSPEKAEGVAKNLRLMQDLSLDTEDGLQQYNFLQNYVSNQIAEFLADHPGALAKEQFLQIELWDRDAHIAEMNFTKEALKRNQMVTKLNAPWRRWLGAPDLTPTPVSAAQEQILK